MFGALVVCLYLCIVKSDKPRHISNKLNFYTMFQTSTTCLSYNTLIIGIFPYEVLTDDNKIEIENLCLEYGLTISKACDIIQYISNGNEVLFEKNVLNDTKTVFIMCKMTRIYLNNY